MINNPLAVFATWFLLAIGGGWFIWASYMAIRFIIEDAQGQHAAFGLVRNYGSSGGAIAVPIILSIVWVVASIPISIGLND